MGCLIYRQATCSSFSDPDVIIHCLIKSLGALGLIPSLRGLFLCWNISARIFSSHVPLNLSLFSLEHKSEKCRFPRCTDSEPAETSTFYAQ
jgi:hypothetical protein